MTKYLILKYIYIHIIKIMQTWFKYIYKKGALILNYKFSISYYIFSPSSLLCGMYVYAIFITYYIFIISNCYSS
jgi:hypothetical protein